jgi:hypothetical protein
MYKFRDCYVKEFKPTPLKSTIMAYNYAHAVEKPNHYHWKQVTVVAIAQWEKYVKRCLIASKPKR